MPRLVAPRAPKGNLSLPRVGVAGPRLTPARRGSEAFEEQAQQAYSEVEEVSWDTFMAFFASKEGWQQGEHVTLIAATGQGKTTLALEILPIRKFMTVFATKAKDDRLYGTLKRDKFKEQKVFDPNPDVTPKILLHPPLKDTSNRSVKEQRAVFEKALHDIYRAGGWGLYLDELKYITDNLALLRNVELLYLQGRSLGVSIIGTSQRPAWIPLVALNQATHLFIGALSDQIDVDRIASAAGRKNPTVKGVVPELEDYQFLYVNTRSSKVPAYKVKVDLKR